MLLDASAKPSRGPWKGLARHAGGELKNREVDRVERRIFLSTLRIRGSCQHRQQRELERVRRNHVVGIVLPRRQNGAT